MQGLGGLGFGAEDVLFHTQMSQKEGFLVGAYCQDQGLQFRILGFRHFGENASGTELYYDITT